MAVLSEALLYCTKGEPLMQALSGWLSFVQLLAVHAPEVLQRVAAQAAVVLLPVLELASQGSRDTAGGAESAAAVSAVDAAAVQLAASVLHEIVVKQRAAVRPALHDMPPLPSLDMLKEVNAVLAKVSSNSVCFSRNVCCGICFMLWPDCRCQTDKADMMQIYLSPNQQSACSRWPWHPLMHGWSLDGDSAGAKLPDPSAASSASHCSTTARVCGRAACWSG